MIAFDCGSSKLHKNGFFFFFSIADINECDDKEPNNCTSNQFCVNDVGSYHCSCLEGYQLDGVACVPNQAAPKLSLAISLTIGKLVVALWQTFFFS